MTQIAGQTDIFAELDEAVPAPPFTVNTCVWATEQRCGWCGGKGYDGGGACRNPKDDTESWFYNYCRSCRDKYGYPKVTREGFALNIDRTQKQRPGARLPDLPGMAPGIVGVREGPKGKLYTLQCERCFTTEEPEHLVLMGIHFHARSRGGENPRLCRDCRLAAYPGCTCDYCRDDVDAKRREQTEGR